ncbi:MAG: cell wall metabolism sensor histidine kinase WalK [Clostridiaceae bacterium]|nr:cell wall metabolism sensor histidine kinase WalK [Clostridiaceae bacterium]
MLKNIQLKIILIFSILGIALISGFGAFLIINLQSIEPQVAVQTVQEIESYREVISMQIHNAKLVTIILIFSYGVISILIGIFVSKAILDPISRLIDSAPKIAAGENVEINNNLDGKDELTSAFNLMTNELRENLNEVNRQKRQIETILLHMTDGIIAFDMEGKIMHINPATTDLLKLTEKDNTFEKIFGKLNIDINLEKTIYLENWTSSEQRVQVEDKYLNIFFASFKDEKDRPSGIMVVIQDITEHVKLDNMRKEFVANVSHELKTPITSIMGYADTLLEGEYDKETQDKFLNVIAQEARRMAKLVTDLLILSRYDSNKVKKEIAEFDLGDLVKKCQEKLQLEINKKGHEVECFVTANVPPVKADKDGIERVVLNILTNSIKYTQDNGSIKIYVGFVYNDAYIKVIDNGIGIPEEDLNRIFDRFYRVDKARTREMGGTGLGLSIAKEILDQNNGSIDIKSQKGKGTEVVIRIPTK